MARAPTQSPAQAIDADHLSRRLRGYPRNHEYLVRDGEIIPRRMLRRRIAAIAPALPTRLGKFLDVGSCKGFFVLQAAAAPECPLAVGIDVHQPFIDISNQVRDHLGRGKARFHLASLDEVAEQPQRFGGPFNTVQVVSTYHYLFWGSELEEKAFGRHDSILNMLASLCGRFLVFANPLEIRDCPAIIQKKASLHGARDFTHDAFLHAADRHFDVFHIGFMDRRHKRPVLLLVRHQNERIDERPDNTQAPSCREPRHAHSAD